VFVRFASGVMPVCERVEWREFGGESSSKSSDNRMRTCFLDIKLPFPHTER
jgi:hypothetical protein